MLHTDIAATGAHRIVKRIVIGYGAELFAIAGAEAMNGLIVEQNLAHRLQREPIPPTGRTLSQRVEAAHTFERVAEEIEA